MLQMACYSHFAFEQEAFEKEFVLNNQKERQNAKTDVAKDIYKLMNNASCGVDCRNNMNNCVFEPIIDEMNEVSYLKMYYNLFEKKILTLEIVNYWKKNLNKNLNKKSQMHKMMIHLKCTG